MPTDSREVDMQLQLDLAKERVIFLEGLLQGAGRPLHAEEAEQVHLSAKAVQLRDNYTGLLCRHALKGVCK